MAATRIWAVKDSVDRAANYIVNPDKTNLANLNQVLVYASDDEKTTLENDDNETVFLVSGVNCSRDTAAEEMQAVQERYDKLTGNLAYHAYQSFKTGEVTPEKAHQIGIELAKKMWGDQYQVLVATHLNTGTYHNHFVMNSVSMWTGKKFNCSKGAYYHFRALSDEICSENNLSVIKNPKGKTPRNIYFSEKASEPTRYNLMRDAIDKGIEMSTSHEMFIKCMENLGYVVKLDLRLKYATIRSVNSSKAMRTFHLGDGYDKDDLFDRIAENRRCNSVEAYRKFGEFRSQIQKKPFQSKHYKVRGNIKTGKKITGLFALYLHYCYLLGYIPKDKPKRTPLSPEMREAWCRINRTTEQVTLLGREHLNTQSEVSAFIESAESRITVVTKAREKIRNKLRNCKGESMISAYKKERDNYTAVLTQLRKEKKIADRIIEDVPKIKQQIKDEVNMRRERFAPTKTRKRGYQR